MRFNIFVLLFSILTIASCNSPENTKAMEEAFEAKISFFLGNDENDGSKIDFTNTLILSPTYQFNQLKCDELCMNLLYSGQAQQVGILNSYRNNILFLEGDINKDVFDLNIFNYRHDFRVYHIEKMESCPPARYFGGIMQGDQFERNQSIEKTVALQIANGNCLIEEKKSIDFLRDVTVLIDITNQEIKKQKDRNRYLIDRLEVYKPDGYGNFNRVIRKTKFTVSRLLMFVIEGEESLFSPNSIKKSSDERSFLDIIKSTLGIISLKTDENSQDLTISLINILRRNAELQVAEHELIDEYISGLNSKNSLNDKDEELLIALVANDHTKTELNTLKGIINTNSDKDFRFLVTAILDKKLKSGSTESANELGEIFKILPDVAIIDNKEKFLKYSKGKLDTQYGTKNIISKLYLFPLQDTRDILNGYLNSDDNLQDLAFINICFYGQQTGEFNYKLIDYYNKIYADDTKNKYELLKAMVATDTINSVDTGKLSESYKELITRLIQQKQNGQADCSLF